MNEGEIVELPVAEIGPGPLVRADRLDYDHVRLLAASLDEVPPVQVRETGKGWSLIDGAHRHAAAKAEGRETIRAVVRSMDDAEALEAAIEANTTHGKPLTADERKAAVRLLIRTTKFSDRRIVEICGVSPATVADLRPKCSGAPQGAPEHPAKREGADGKEYPSPGVAAAARRRAEEAHEANPDLSVRELAKLAGCSTGTAQSVKNSQREATSPPPPAGNHPDPDAPHAAAGGQSDGEGSPARPLSVVPPTSDETTVGELLDPVPVPGAWAKDPLCKKSNAAQAFARFADRRMVRADEDMPAEIAADCPAEYRTGAARQARDAAQFWTALASQLENATRLASVEDA